MLYIEQYPEDFGAARRLLDECAASNLHAKMAETVMDSFISRPSSVDSQKREIGEMRPFFSSMVERVERRMAEKSGMTRLSRLLESREPAQGREAIQPEMLSLARGPLSGTPTGAMVEDVLRLSSEAVARFEHAITSVRGKNWAGVLKGRLFVGTADEGVTAADVFLCGWRSLDEISAHAAREAIRNGQNSPAVFALLGKHRLRAKDAKGALETLEQDARHHPGNARILLSLGKARHDSGSVSAARAALEEASAILGADMPAWASDLLAKIGGKR